MAGAQRPGVVKPLETKQSKVFFFEKKNQKTIISFESLRFHRFELSAGSNGQKFFASFFQKRSALLHSFLFAYTWALTWEETTDA